MAKLTRKEMSKIICNHLRKDSLVDGVNETYLISSVMDALKEIETINAKNDHQSLVKTLADAYKPIDVTTFGR